jgi:hypothetical protein
VAGRASSKRSAGAATTALRSSSESRMRRAMASSSASASSVFEGKPRRKSALWSPHPGAAIDRNPSRIESLTFAAPMAIAAANQ